MHTGHFWYRARPPTPLHIFPFLVFDHQDKLHLPLTTLGQYLLRRLVEPTVRGYVRALLPFFTALATSPAFVDQAADWRDPPERVREHLALYLNQQCAYKVGLEQKGMRFVKPTASSTRYAAVLLTALKHFYAVAIKEGWYTSANPLLVAPVSRERINPATGRPHQSAAGGVDPPRQDRRLTSSYFVLVDKTWVPQVVDDPALAKRMLDAGEAIGWSLCDTVITRLLFETGARLFEVLTLTLDDYYSRTSPIEFAAASKGSHGMRVKYLCCSAATITLFERYCATERRRFDPTHRTLEEHRRAVNRKPDGLRTVSLFLSNRGTPLSADAFRTRAWTPACQHAHIDVDIHQARHWYVTMAMRQLYRTAQSPEDLAQRRAALVTYMAWHSGETMLDIYSHAYDPSRHAETQAAVFESVDNPQPYIDSPSSSTRGEALADDDLALLYSFGGATDEDS